MPFDYLFVFSSLSSLLTLPLSHSLTLPQSIIQLLQPGTVRCGSFWPRPDTWPASVTVFLLVFGESKWESIVPACCEVWQRLMYSGSVLYAYRHKTQGIYIYGRCLKQIKLCSRRLHPHLQRALRV